MNRIFQPDDHYDWAEPGDTLTEVNDTGAGAGAGAGVLTSHDYFKDKCDVKVQARKLLASLPAEFPGFVNCMLAASVCLYFGGGVREGIQDKSCAYTFV